MAHTGGSCERQHRQALSLTSEPQSGPDSCRAKSVIGARLALNAESQKRRCHPERTGNLLDGLKARDMTLFSLKMYHRAAVGKAGCLRHRVEAETCSIARLFQTRGKAKVQRIPTPLNHGTW